MAILTASYDLFCIFLVVSHKNDMPLSLSCNIDIAIQHLFYTTFLWYYCALIFHPICILFYSSSWSKTRLFGRLHFTDDPTVVQRLVTPGRMTLAKEGILISVCMFGAFFGNIFWGALADSFGRKTILEIAMFIMFFMSVFSVRKR